MRLTPGGVIQEIRPEGAELLAPESSTTVLRVPEPREGRPSVHTVQRVDVGTGTVTALTKLPGHWARSSGTSDIDALAVLDDGTIVVATVAGFYAIAPNGHAFRLSHSNAVWRNTLAPLPGRRFAFLEESHLMVGDLAGTRHILTPGSFAGPLTASDDGGVLATLDEQDDSTGKVTRTIVRVGPDGAVARLLTPPERPGTTLGHGDGLSPYQDEMPPGVVGYTAGAMALAADGTLVFPDHTGYGLRALVPPGSGRPRIALTQDTYATFESGRIRYTASRPGAVTVSASAHGSVAVEGHGETSGAGEEELALASVPAPGRYTVRLRLTTPSGGAQTVAVIDTRLVLPSAEARSALKSAYEDSAGDDGGATGTGLGDCRRQAPRALRCLLLSFEYSHAFDGPDVGAESEINTPMAWVTATLLNDGVHTSSEPLPAAEDVPSACFGVSVERHQRVGGGRALVARVRARCSVHVRVAANLSWGKGRRARHAIVRRSRAMRPGQRWNVQLRVPHKVVAAVDAHRGVSGQIDITAAIPTPYGPIPEGHHIPVFLRR
jgi:hypothetical protein